LSLCSRLASKLGKGAATDQTRDEKYLYEHLGHDALMGIDA
jgi:hypothetical protein